MREAYHWLSYHIRNKAVKVVQGELFVPMVNNSICVWTKQFREAEAERTHCTSGEAPSFIAAKVPLCLVWTGQLSLPFSHLSSHGFPHGKLCAKLQQGTSEVFCWDKTTWSDTTIYGTAGNLVESVYTPDWLELKNSDTSMCLRGVWVFSAKYKKKWMTSKVMLRSKPSWFGVK